MGTLLENPALPSTRAYFWLLLSGALVIVPVGLAGIAVAGMPADGGSALVRNAALAFLGSSLPEEIARFAVLCLFGLWRADSLRPRDGLIFGAVASLGFSIAENLLYGFTLGASMALLKLAMATPIHLALGVMMGGFLVLAGHEVAGRRRMMRALALALPVLMHGIYDLAILTAIGNDGPDNSVFIRLAPPVLSYAIVIGLAAWMVLRIRRTEATASVR